MVRGPLRLPIAVNRPYLRSLRSSSQLLHSRDNTNLDRRNHSLHSRHRANIPSEPIWLRRTTAMDASKLTNGSRDEVLAKHSAPESKSGQPNAMRSEAKKVGKRAIGRKGKTERPQVKAVRKSKSDKLVCRYCGSDDFSPSFIKRRDRRCRKCFSKRYRSAARTRKTKVKK